VGKAEKEKEAPAEEAPKKEADEVPKAKEAEEEEDKKGPPITQFYFIFVCFSLFLFGLVFILQSNINLRIRRTIKNNLDGADLGVIGHVVRQCMYVLTAQRAIQV